MMPGEVRHLEGPLVVVGDRRKPLVQSMAATLVRLNTFQDERDAIRSLRGTYAMADIVMLIDDARQAAMQTVVAEEMGKP